MIFLIETLFLIKSPLVIAKQRLLTWLTVAKRRMTVAKRRMAVARRFDVGS